MRIIIFGLISILVLSGCVSSGGRYSQRNDSAPHRLPSNITTQDAKPVYEDYNQVNSRSYEVLGKRYQPLQTGKGYEAVGRASWYGQKFHGHLTANGEVYNMYEMTAAHKTLPIPSYVKVTNLDNQQTAIVRVNDRGPFHGNRLIDLSYAAARKLGILKTGTAHVKLQVVHVTPDGQITVGKEKPNPASPLNQESDRALFIQVAALQDQRKIDALAKGLTMLYQVPTHVPEGNGIYRLRLGPLSNEQEAKKLLNELKANGYHNAYTVYDQFQVTQ
ncbi:septal ring lytic transglycosylase RlpA family protein [Alteromonas sp. a30]|uniref:septal ring lytic transglycosylase RlpA family protein n=1 Tax=Alteromonas sp. a30 TaxID=2730917 RepID=UPI00227F2461|nr:septal ring lytic transglycosylase RlpA family protein [Alteromonas sp. a30]MCY7297125.1 septal ring lytic transglycosylase RlpA family protein [Alteromonas sp. a30]